MPDTPGRDRLRTTFDEVAELYDRARPRYPEPVFDDLVALTGLGEGDRVLEIGCGTGQATLPLAQRGLAIVCVELGEQLAAVARRKLARFPAVEIVTADFETWEPADERFHAVVAFTAFHWIAPEVRYAKAASLLHAGGAFAIVATQHVLPTDGDPFFAEVQADYEAVVPDDDKTKAGGPPPPEAVADLGGEVAASGCFRNVAARRYVWDVVYTADEYIAVLDTYSGHRALDARTRRLLYEQIRHRIESRPEQKVRKTYLATLNVAMAAGS